ncbi:Like-Sm protein 1 [Blastocystis sp. ATCC 50177/Nand II]|uniref:Like-Sm protein 1 n=1 Tax=Blastocystis sp. subtype 1 (strain ATCC 50177 / NandII) TaxID=478820 RepID=A0A196SEL7_BLAHN|nr:Like-Sm protein 1 [Blastocystis sp. ATCC 50177/Nand II]
MSCLTPVSGLLLLVDKPVLVVRTDGTHFYGILRTVDQHENVMLEDSFERIFWDFYYTDSPTGFQMIQGSNIAFISSLKGTLDNCPLEGLTALSNEEFLEYVSLSDEEKLQRNGGKECPFAGHYSYKVKLA